MSEPVPIPWPLSSAPGERPQESAGRLINVYAEPIQPESGPGTVIWRRCPGLTSFAETGEMTFRGGILVNNLAFVALEDVLLTVDELGVVTTVGTLTGAEPVTFARNNKSPTPDICCVTENGAFLVTSGSISSWPDADLPIPNSVTAQDGYFFWSIGDNRAFASEINSTNVNSLTFTAIQSRASSSLMRAIAYGGLMYWFCSNSIEVFQNAGASIAAPAFPYARLSVIDRGLLGANAIAGWEDGFGKLLWVADDFGVYRLNGFKEEKVSPPDLDRLIRAVTDRATLRASCYVHAGHSIWVISCPSWTWEFNLNTSKWNERESTVNGMQTAWRGQGSLLAFKKWLMGSSATGDIVYIDDLARTEEGDPLGFIMESGPVQNFPHRVRVPYADFNFITGVGIPSGTTGQKNPQCSISWSDNGGVRWGVPVIRSLGVGNDSARRVSINGVGMSGSQGRRWRIAVTDAVYSGFLGAVMGRTLRRPQ